MVKRSGRKGTLSDITREECKRSDRKSRRIAACASICGVAGAYRAFSCIMADPKCNLVDDVPLMLLLVAGVGFCLWSMAIDLRWRTKFDAMIAKWGEEHP